MHRLLPPLIALIALSGCGDSTDPNEAGVAAHASTQAAPPLAFNFQSPAQGEARCRFVIDPNNHADPAATPLPEARWRTFVDGPCRYHFFPPVTDSAEEGGTLILTEMGAQTRLDAAGDIENAYFVYLNFRGRQFLTADGSWNGVREATHAHTTFGSVPDYPMRRDGACWVSDRARICLTR